MINFFRKIRKKLADENRPIKYMRYAIGEILLIVIGIFFALQLQNWNENRRQEAEYRVVIEQVYNAMNYDAENSDGYLSMLDNRIEVIGYFLNQADSIPREEIPYLLYFLTSWNADYNSEVKYHSKYIKNNPNNIEQNNINRAIAGYLSSLSGSNEINNPIRSIFADLNIPTPKINLSDINDLFDKSDSSYYSEQHFKKLESLIRSEKFKVILKSLQSDLSISRVEISNILEDCRSILDMIKNYYPQVQLLYDEVGIIGTSINGYDREGAKSTKMLLMNADNNIWEIEMYLKEGTVKFRCRDSWTVNWGGTDFPMGEAFPNGPNIPIEEAGHYKVILNISQNTYEFRKQEDVKNE